MDYVPGLEIAAGCDDRVADGAAPDPTALFVNSKTAFAVNRAVRAYTFVQPPARSGHDRIGVLVGNVTGHKAQRRFADGLLHGREGLVHRWADQRSQFNAGNFGFKRADLLHQHGMVMYGCYYEYTTYLPNRGQAHTEPA